MEKITKLQALEAKNTTERLTTAIQSIGDIAEKSAKIIENIATAMENDNADGLTKIMATADNTTLEVASDISIAKYLDTLIGQDYKDIITHSAEYASLLVLSSMQKEKVRTSYESCAMIYAQCKRLDNIKERGKGNKLDINGIQIGNDTQLAVAFGLTQGSISRIRTFFKHIDKKPALIDDKYAFLKLRNLEYLYGVGLMWDVDKRFKPTGEETALYLIEKARKIKNKANKPDSNKPDSNKPDSNKPDSNKPDSDKPDSNNPDNISTNRTLEQFKEEFNSVDGIKKVMGSLVLDWVNTLEKGDNIHKELSALYSEILGKIREHINNTNQTKT